MQQHLLVAAATGKGGCIIFSKTINAGLRSIAAGAAEDVSRLRNALIILI